MLEILNKLNHYSVEQPDMIALSFEEDVLTYQELYTAIQQLKSVFIFTERVPSRIRSIKVLYIIC